MKNYSRCFCRLCLNSISILYIDIYKPVTKEEWDKCKVYPKMCEYEDGPFGNHVQYSTNLTGGLSKAMQGFGMEGRKSNLRLVREEIVYAGPKLSNNVSRKPELTLISQGESL